MTAEPRFRAHARRKVRLKVLVWHPRSGWEREADVQDLGFGGACIRLADRLAVNDDVHISFVAPTLWDPLTIPGRVAWIGPATHLESARAGIAFEPVEGASMLALFELLGTFGYEV